MTGEVFAIVGVFGTLALSVVTIARGVFENMRRSRTEKTQLEVFNKLMDKLGSGQEVLSYLQTEAGQNLLKTAPETVQAAPYARILNSVQRGVVAGFLGGAMLATKNTMLDSEARVVTEVLGTLVLAVGLGLLVAAGASYLLSKNFGLLNGNKETQL